MSKSWRYNVTITKVIDGDTFVVENFDLGMGVYLDKVTCRLYGVDTPETRSKNKEEKQRGLEVKRIVQSFIEGREVALESMELDKYGRVLARITFDRGDLSEFLIKEKLARPYFGDSRK